MVGWRQDRREEPQESWGVIDEVIYGDLGKGEIRLELNKWLKRDFVTEDGWCLRLGAVCIDSGRHHTQEVYRFRNTRVGRHIYAIKGHAFWDGVITSSRNISRLRSDATKLRTRPEFARDNFTELAVKDFEGWGKESFEIAVRVAYQSGALRGTAKGRRADCGVIPNVAVLPAGYASTAGSIGERRIILAGYRLADVLKQLFAK